MSGFSRLAVAAALVAGFGSTVQAQGQSQSLRAPAGQGEYYALSDRGTADRSARGSGVVAPSMSDTVMGLRVPR